MKKHLLYLILTSFLVSCGAEKEVKWEALSELDNLSILVENAAFEHEAEKQKELLTQANALIPKVVGSVPDNAKNKEQVGILLKDLSSLSTEMAKAGDLDQGSLDGLSKSIHPIVARIMETSGVPHVHATEDGHDPATCTDPTHNH